MDQGEISLSAHAGKGAGNVVFLTLGTGQAYDEHVLGKPSSISRHHRGDAQREALFAK